MAGVDLFLRDRPLSLNLFPPWLPLCRLSVWLALPDQRAAPRAPAGPHRTPGPISQHGSGRCPGATRDFCRVALRPGTLLGSSMDVRGGLVTARPQIATTHQTGRCHGPCPRSVSGSGPRTVGGGETVGRRGPGRTPCRAAHAVRLRGPGRAPAPCPALGGGGRMGDPPPRVLPGSSGPTPPHPPTHP